MSSSLDRYYDVVHADELSNRFDSSERCGFEVETDSLPEDWGGWCCYRPVWNDTNLCIWHAKEKIKPSRDLHEAQEFERTWPQEFGSTDRIRRLDHAQLRSYSVDEKRQEDDFRSPLSFSSCTLFNANFYDSDFSRSSFNNVHLNRANFERATCRHTLFQGCEFDETIFKHAILEDAHIMRQSIQDADWVGVRLTGANLHGSNLRRSNLRLAKLEDAYMTQASLQECNLEESNMENADLRDADLRDVKLNEALIRNIRINEGTTFGEMCLYEQEADREAGGVVNHDTVFSNRLKNTVKRFANRALNHSGDSESLRKAIRMYRLYQRLLREASLPEEIRIFRVRERHSRRKLALQQNQYPKWLKLSFDRWAMLYGESPRRVVGTSVGVILLFTMLYAVFGEFSSSPSSIGQYLYFSAASFTALVFGDLHPANEATRILASIESFTGALLMALLVFVLGRRATW